MLAAPFAALMTRALPPRILTIIVGLIVTGLSLTYLANKFTH